MRLLIIGKPDTQISLASEIAQTRGATVSQAPDAESALNQLRNGRGADLIMMDVDHDIAGFITSLNNERFASPLVAFGYSNNAEAAVKAIKAGAKEYVPLPPNKDLIAAVLEAITEESSQILFKSTAMEKVVKVAKQVSGADANVLITGESGTGKEVMARYIHQQSKRAKQAFITVNCAAIPENLLESEMFGHERGAFTGALTRRIGKFEEANGGTLLLDEISEMDIRLQAKLLRAIQEQEIDRVGGNKPVKLSVRILATSNRNLQKEVEKGTFRGDLFFRLNIIHLQMPSLKERPEDIPMLASHFAEKYAKANDVPAVPITDAAMKMLLAYHWPGNVRELENTLHRAVLLASGGVISPEAIMLSDAGGSPAATAAAPQGGALVGRTMDSVEKELILNTLDHCLGNRTHAANILGISIRTLRNKLKQYEENAAKTGSM
ncbi:MAG: sigma-54-dependent Fis family transcriptional regulator [Proteobacteria bacterium]|nr:sigma-54-dependent Fis family transcriptional regulator [Pseudomonadota bacterium]